MQVILSTRNPGKLKEIRTIFEGSGIAILSLDDVEIAGEAVEDGTTLGENALKKARYAWDRTKEWCMADDTGLYIDALGGKPGIHAARWAGEGPLGTIMHYTLAQLVGVPPEKRTATFKTVAVLIAPDGTEHPFIGEAKGTLLTEPRTPCQPGMHYDPIFVPFGGTKAWSEVPLAEKSAIDHRGRAFRQVREYLENLKV